ncbi:unnamed protein product [Clonostachys byssicola]|uniref:Zn(2)-C6 fungal-type domain-containing protein n=1 Tax=Clonostachys byssicola TaxID=160290 RepID=A0A9N9XXF7_9HYPO|nr:unnamed protein product [Clonostachys byssicola]
MPRRSSNKRSMTYKGCWTCKRRKVKCDEKPTRCGNCTRLRLECEGYGVRLHWTTDSFSTKSESSSLQNRGRMNIDPESYPVYPMNDIDRFIASIDRDSHAKKASQHGPFNLLLLPLIQKELHNDSDTIIEVEHHIEGSHCTSLSVSSTSSSSTPDHELEATFQAVVADTGHAPEVFPPDSPVHNLSDGDLNLVQVVTEDYQEEENDTAENGEEVQEHVDIENAASPQKSTSTTLCSGGLSAFCLQRYVASSLSGDPEIDMLLHHYIINLADLLQAVHHPQNPYRQLYAPAALESVSGTALSTPASFSPKSIINTAIYHSILAASAFHMWQSNPLQRAFHHVASQHRQKALFFLQTALDTMRPGAEYRLLLIAMLSLVTVDVMSGAEADFTVHLHATLQLRRSRRHWKVVSPATQQLNEISEFLTLLARTLSFHPSSPLWCADHGDGKGNGNDDVPLAQGSNQCLGYMYGITITIANAIKETCRLAETITCIEERQNEALPEWLRQACEDLGDLLLSWTLDEAEVNSIANEEMRAVFKHHAHAWHHAALIYYCRRVQKVPSSELSEEASIVAEHMHAVETLKATSRSEQASRMAPITWPAFIASCDAIDRDVWMDWWERVKHYKIANIPRQYDVVRELWEIIDEKTQSGDCSIDWITVYKELDITLLPI